MSGPAPIDEVRVAERPAARRPRHWQLVARACLLLLPAWWLARSVHPRVLLEALGKLGVGGVATASSLLIVSSVAGAVRWRLLLTAYGGVRVPPLLTVLRHILIGQYYNMLPGAVAGEAVRAHRVRGVFANPDTTYLVVVVDRLMGLVGIAALAAAALLMGAAPTKLAPGAIAVVVSLAAVGATVGLIAPAAVERWGALRAGVRRIPLLGPRLAALKSPRGKLTLAKAALLSVVTQASVALAVSLLAIWGSPGAQVALVMGLSPIVVLLTFVPVTPGGIGQREAVFAATFSLAGVPEAAAVAAGVAFFAAALVIPLSGAACLALERLGVLSDSPAAIAHK